MNLETRKIEFVQEFLKLQSEEAVERLEGLLRKEKEILFQESLQPKWSKQAYWEIEESLEDSRNDRVTKARDLKPRAQR